MEVLNAWIWCSLQESLLFVGSTSTNQQWTQQWKGQNLIRLLSIVLWYNWVLNRYVSFLLEEPLSPRFVTQTSATVWLEPRSTLPPCILRRVSGWTAVVTQVGIPLAINGQIGIVSARYRTLSCGPAQSQVEVHDSRAWRVIRKQKSQWDVTDVGKNSHRDGSHSELLQITYIFRGGGFVYVLARSSVVFNSQLPAACRAAMHCDGPGYSGIHHNFSTTPSVISGLC